MIVMAEFELSSVEKAVKGHLPKALELSRSLREHPELPDQEFESSRKMVEILKEAGFEVTYPFAGYETHSMPSSTTVTARKWQFWRNTMHFRKSDMAAATIFTALFPY